MPEESVTKILTFQPLVYHPGDERFQVTNLGAIVKGLRGLGFHSQQLALAQSAELVGREVDGVLLCSMEQVSDSNWWKQQQPWGVIFNSWGRFQYQKIWQSAMQATPRVIERLDTDGMRSPRIEYPLYVFRAYSGFADSRKVWRRQARHFLAPIYLLASAALPEKVDRPTTAALAALPAVTAESPIAAERIKRLLRHFGHSDKNIHVSPFPVKENALPPVQAFENKQNLLISVGRWAAHQKNFPMMLRVLGKFLQNNPEWTAVLPGTLPVNANDLIERFAPSSRTRINLPGPLPNEAIHHHMQKAKIFLMTSRHESFGIAAAEALCSGCSVVGPHHIPSVPWFCGSDSGTVATWYSVNGMLDALEAERTMWASGQRDPIQIATTWRSRVSSSQVARHCIELMESIRPT